MSDSLPTRARIVVIGGGILGCSIAYWLTKMGENDVVLLEQHQLTDGAKPSREMLVPLTVTDSSLICTAPVGQGRRR